MARTGDIIANPLTGEEMTFLQTAADTSGEVLRISMRVRPGGFSAAEHIHREQEERFRVEQGEIRLRHAGSERVLGEGERVAIPAGDPHVWTNAGPHEAVVELEFVPAGTIEELFENLFGLARDGKTNQRGEPNMLQCAVFAPEYGLYMGKPPVPVQRAVFTVVRPIAKALGYRARYDKYVASR
jgi:mannose-6-phosphate isomerase-like protein (cupin superfamily)